MYQGYFHRSSWCGEEQPAASPKPQEQDRESSPYFVPQCAARNPAAIASRIFETKPISDYVFHFKVKIGQFPHSVLLMILVS